MIFSDAEEAWFWFMRCSGEDYKLALHILDAVDRIHRKRMLSRDHLLVMRHYGRRGQVPCADRTQEARSQMLWDEAMKTIQPALIRLGIVEEKHTNDNEKRKNNDA